MEWQEYKDTDTPAEVLRQLVAMGYEVAERTFYRHCDKGKCRKNEQGLYSRRMVGDYVKAVPLIRSGEREAEDGPDMAMSLQKQRLENEKLEIHNKREKMKLARDEGRVIEREGLYLEIAARQVAMDGMFRQKIEMDGPQIIAAVNGDPARLPDFNELVFAIWGELMTAFANVEEFEVLFEDEEDGD